MTDQAMAKNLEKLSSGYRINRAGDDAAGLAISEAMRNQITAMNQGKRNVQDGISLVQTVEGALTEAHAMLNRMKGMAVQAANGTYTDSERAMLNSEMQELKAEITRIGDSTTFSGVPLFIRGGTKRNVTMTSYYACTLDLSSKEVHVNHSSSASQAAGRAASAGGYEQLAETIATEYFPNAVQQIMDSFPSLKAAVGSDKVEMELCIEYTDGPGGMMAYAQASFHAQGKPFNMQIIVDAADFSDESVQDGSPDQAALKSTIAHELMHSVMQYTLTDGMFGRNGHEKYPEWFVEGTAQLAGGGFPTGWNNSLQQIAGQLSSGDSSRDGDIANYLKSYDVKDRPYGHGYLAAAYIGYLANGGTGPVTGAGIAAGMDKLFNDLQNNPSLYNVLSTHTNGKITSMADLEALFDHPTSDLTEFVRELSIASKGGAGSVIATDLSVGGGDFIGDTVKEAAFSVKSWRIGAVGKLSLSTGGYNQMIDVNLFRLDSVGLRISDTNILTLKDANKGMEEIDNAINRVSEMRSHYGAIQNRLEHTYNSLSVTVENLTAAESNIRDTDMAYAITEHVRNQILFQSGQAMLAQANHMPENLLSLLGA